MHEPQHRIDRDAGEEREEGRLEGAPIASQRLQPDRVQDPVPQRIGRDREWMPTPIQRGGDGLGVGKDPRD
ncbi:MAG TPA: hypothetical protein VES03_01615 [Motilibacterales bacterium]|nr:hypothetical protein [Motilibacterales bacterium]